MVGITKLKGVYCPESDLHDIEVYLKEGHLEIYCLDCNQVYPFMNEKDIALEFYEIWKLLDIPTIHKTIDLIQNLMKKYNFDRWRKIEITKVVDKPNNII